VGNYEDVYYTVADGLTLYARDYAGPNADSPVALCMHGLTRNSRDFAELAPILARSHRVVVPEQRGRGKSEYDSDIQRYNPLTYNGDTFALLAHLGISRCAVVGTSMGGLMAMGMNAVAPELFSHVVLNDIGPEIAEEGLNRIKSYVGTGGACENWEQAVAVTQTLGAAAFPNYTTAQWQQFAKQIFVERDGQVVLDYDPQIAAPMREDDSAAVPPDLWPVYDLLATKPLLLVRGEITDLLDMSCVEEMQRRHPAMRLLSVPEVGHAPQLNEAGVAETIAEFINS